MITGIRGTLEATGPDWVVITLGGISLQIFVPTSVIPELGGAGATVRLHTRLMVRDDSLVLHGFTTEEALTIFDLLIGVSGIGPKHAHSILSTLAPAALISAVATEDTKAISQVPGMGQRTAARIIVELKGKMDTIGVGGTASPANSAADDVTEALQALGYSAIEARIAVTTAGADSTLPVEEQIRLALQSISQR